MADNYTTANGHRIYYPGQHRSRPRRDILDRRAGDRKTWTYIYRPITADQIKPFDITLERSKNIQTCWPILWFSHIPGKEDAWFDHAGQILEDGKTVSEAVLGGMVHTPLEQIVEKNDRGKCRLTIVRLRDDIFPTEAIRREAYEACQMYHEYIEGDSYEVLQLFRMMLMSMARSIDPFSDGQAWLNIPYEQVMICSAIVDYGWRVLQELIDQDIFPSTLSKTVPSPMDIWWSFVTEFVCGWEKVYN